MKADPTQEGAYLLDRIARSSHRAGDCVIWDLSCNGTSPVMSVDRHPRIVRRVVYEHSVGPVLPTHDIVPTCGTFKCVASAHLEQIERGEHRRRVAFKRHAGVGNDHSVDELTELATRQAEAAKARLRADVAVMAARAGKIANSVFAWRQGRAA